jgi:hypothetical protein
MGQMLSNSNTTHKRKNKGEDGRRRNAWWHILPWKEREGKKRTFFPTSLKPLIFIKK